MAVNSKQLNEEGYAICAVCRKKFFIGDLQSCSYCDRFACKTCSTKKGRFTACKKCAK